MVSWRPVEWPVQHIGELITELFLPEPKLKTHKAVERPQDKVICPGKVGMDHRFDYRDILSHFYRLIVFWPALAYVVL